MLWDGGSYHCHFKLFKEKKVTPLTNKQNKTNKRLQPKPDNVHTVSSRNSISELSFHLPSPVCPLAYPSKCGYAYDSIHSSFIGFFSGLFCFPFGVVLCIDNKKQQHISQTSHFRDESKKTKQEGMEIIIKCNVAERLFPLRIRLSQQVHRNIHK